MYQMKEQDKTPEKQLNEVDIGNLSPHATTTEAYMPRACALQQEKPPQWESRAPQRRVAPAHHSYRKACAQQRRPKAAKNK